MFKNLQVKCSPPTHTLDCQQTGLKEQLERVGWESGHHRRTKDRSCNWTMHVEGLPLVSLEDKVWLTVFKNVGVWFIVYGQVIEEMEKMSL